MKIRFLGTGTSTGIPQIGCRCATCTSTDTRDKRMRASVLVESDDGGTRLLVDCGPDFYHQILAAGEPALDAVLLTHSHYDHVGGIDDLRPYCASGPFDIYCRSDVENDLRSRIPYCFYTDPYPGVPSFRFHNLEAGRVFTIGDTEVMPLEVMHGQLPIFGYRIGNVGYITDCKTMPDPTVKALEGIDTLVINALRRESHHSHLSLSEALELIEKIRPRQAFLTHLSHQMGRHAEAELLLPRNVRIAYDGMSVESGTTITV